MTFKLKAVIQLRVKSEQMLVKNLDHNVCKDEGKHASVIQEEKYYPDLIFLLLLLLNKTHFSYLHSEKELSNKVFAFEKLVENDLGSKWHILLKCSH